MNDNCIDTNAVKAMESSTGEMVSQDENDCSDENEQEEDFETSELLNTFRLLTEKLEEYDPLIPNNLTANILARSGLITNDKRIVAMISLVAQKFVSDIALDALTHCKMRQAGGFKKGVKDKKYSMTTDDLRVALSEKGISLKKPPSYFRYDASTFYNLVKTQIRKVTKYKWTKCKNDKIQKDIKQIGQCKKTQIQI